MRSRSVAQRSGSEGPTGEDRRPERTREQRPIDRKASRLGRLRGILRVLYLVFFDRSDPGAYFGLRTLDGSECTQAKGTRLQGTFCQAGALRGIARRPKPLSRTSTQGRWGPALVHLPDKISKKLKKRRCGVRSPRRGPKTVVQRWVYPSDPTPRLAG